MQKYRQGLEVWGLQVKPTGGSNFMGIFTHANTVDRTYTLPNSSGTLALLADIPGVNAGTFSIAAGTAGATNTSIALNLSAAWNANSSTNVTINPVVGPAITTLVALMAGGASGFVKKTAADTYTLDTNAYLTTLSDTLATVTARGATTAVAITALNFIKSGGISSQFLKADGSVDSTAYTANLGTVTAIGVTTANGVSGTSSGGATPNLTITLGAITPSSVASTGAISGTSGTFTGLTVNGNISVGGGDAGVTTPQRVLTVFGGSNTDLAPVIQWYRAGQIVFGSAIAASGKLKFGTWASNTDALITASTGMTLDSAGAVLATSFNAITGLASVAPLMNGTQTLGTSTLAARQDHIHASDTSRQAALNGTGFVKTVGTTVSYDNSSYALSSHMTHSWVDGAYYYEDYTQSKNYRTLFQTALSDTIRYCTISAVEYWNGSAWVAWTGGDATIRLLLDGRDDTDVQIDHNHRKFRFVVDKSSGWPLQTVCVIQSQWTGFTRTDITVTLENNVASVWTVRDTCVFSAANTGPSFGIHAKAQSTLHDGNAQSRITVDITDWVDNASYTTYPITNINLFSNFTGTAISPWTWDYYRNVTFPATVTATSFYGSSFNGAGTGLTGTAAGLSIGGNAVTATTATYSSSSTCLSNIGYGNGNLTWFQTSGDFDGTTGYASYIISNHGDGASYYHQTIRLPFWSVPQYRRQTGDTSLVTPWYDFISSENIGNTGLAIGGTTGVFSGEVSAGTANIGGVGFTGSGYIYATVPNLVLSSSGTGTTYLNYNSGTGGVNFCDGATHVVASISGAGAGVFSSSVTASSFVNSIVDTDRSAGYLSQVYGNAVLWGHSNTQYLSTLSNYSNNGYPVISFYSYQSSGTINTLKRSSGTIIPTWIEAADTGIIYFRSAAAGTIDTEITSGVTSNAWISSAGINATAFIKTSGTSSQFLKADGSVDVNAYAIDSTVVHLAGTETITGSKSFTGNTIFGSGGGRQILIGASGNIEIQAGTLGWVEALYFKNIALSNYLGGFGAYGSGDTINYHWIGGVYDSPKMKVDQSGYVTANQFIKTGGTSLQFLKADGSVDSSTYSTTAHNHTGVYQPLATNLTTIGALANAVGFLYNNGSGTFSYVAAGSGTVTSVDTTAANNGITATWATTTTTPRLTIGLGAITPTSINTGTGVFSGSVSMGALTATAGSFSGALAATTATINGRLFNAFQGANSNGYNTWIGGGGQSSIGEIGATNKGSYNSAMGMQALSSNTTGSYNSAMGVQALFNNTTGYYNSAMGMSALFNNTTGFFNSAMGVSALSSNTTGSYNSAMGVQALFDLNIIANDGSGSNTAIGYNTGRGIVTGVNNTILGASVTGLAAGLSNNIILANGTGAIKAQHDGSNWTLIGAVSMGALTATTGNFTGSVASAQFNGSGAGLTGTASSLTAGAANTFGGLASSCFVQGMNSNRTTNDADFNAYKPSGFYDNSSATGAPTASWYHMINSAHDNSGTGNLYQFQIATEFWNKSDFFMRSISPGAVGLWRKLVHDGNIASQSVANASTTLQPYCNGLNTGSVYLTGFNSQSIGYGSLYTTNAFISNYIIYASDFSASSDERLKENWEDLPIDFISQLSKVKVGTYHRIDNNIMSIGASAQSLQIVMPLAIHTDDKGMLSISYGNAALVSAVELAKEIEKLKIQIEELKKKIL